MAICKGEWDCGTAIGTTVGQGNHGTGEGTGESLNSHCQFQGEPERGPPALLPILPWTGALTSRGCQEIVAGRIHWDAIRHKDIEGSRVTPHHAEYITSVVLLGP